MSRKCKGCPKDISHKHSNAKFCKQKCKDTYWNNKNPRGKFGHLQREQEVEVEDGSWDAHKDTFK